MKYRGVKGQCWIELNTAAYTNTPKWYTTFGNTNMNEIPFSVFCLLDIITYIEKPCWRHVTSRKYKLIFMWYFACTKKWKVISLIKKGSIIKMLDHLGQKLMLTTIVDLHISSSGEALIKVKTWLINIIYLQLLKIQNWWFTIFLKILKSLNLELFWILQNSG